jgi:hypothetical protein
MSVMASRKERLAAMERARGLTPEVFDDPPPPTRGPTLDPATGAKFLDIDLLDWVLAHQQEVPDAFKAETRGWAEEEWLIYREIGIRTQNLYGAAIWAELAASRRRRRES